MHFERRLRRVPLALSVFVLTTIVWRNTAAQSPEHQPTLTHFDAAVVDRTVDPCVDFYKFACGKWLATNPPPPGEGLWNTRSDLQLWNWTVVRQAMEGLARPDTTRNPVEQKLGDYWYACMDEAGIESKGIQPIQDELKFIDSLQRTSRLAEVVARLHVNFPGVTAANVNQTNAVLFGLSRVQDPGDPTIIQPAWDQGGIALPNRDFYLREDPKSAEIRTEYEAHVRRMFELAGMGSKEAANNANVVLKIENELAKGQLDAATRRNIQNSLHPVSLKELRALAPSFDFDHYLSLIGASPSGRHVVYAPEFFRVVGRLMEREPLDNWKVYLKWWVLHSSADYLPKRFRDESFNFYGRVIQGAKQPVPRWQSCVNSAERDMGEAVGQAYVQRAFALTSKERMETMFASTRLALAEDLRQLDWMSEATKKEALHKLEGMRQQIGYPDKWRDYAGLQVSRESFFGNVQRAASFEFHRQAAMFGKPIDRAEWYISVPTVDAQFYPQLNQIAFPAGILQPPLFDSAQDDAVNYGAIGMVIGHEITHNFDTRGRHFDEIGRLRDWWTTADAEKFEARGQCFVSEYTQQVPQLGLKTNGVLTEAEDIADNGGLRLALMALKNTYAKQGKSLEAQGPDGWTALQKFFLADAFDWCENTRPEMERTWVLSNGHSLPRFRTNNVLANFPEFREAFGCTPGKPMVRENACRVW